MAAFLSLPSSTDGHHKRNMGPLLLLLVPCLVAGVGAQDLAGSSIITSSLPPLPFPSSPISPPSNPSGIPLLSFHDIPPQLTACESATFNWTYEDSVVLQLILSIVTDANATPSFNRVISSTVDPNLNSYTWPDVDVPQGQYTLYATIPSRSFNTSANFYVQTGSDLSCLISSDTTSKSSINVAAIVGGVLGGTALVFSAAIMFVLCRRHRSESKRGHGPKGGKSLRLSTARPRSWDKFGSGDSRYQNRHPISQTSFADSVNLPVLEYAGYGYGGMSGDEKLKHSSLHKHSPSDGVLSPRSRRASAASSIVASTALSHVTGPQILPKVSPPSYRSPSPGSEEAGNPLDLARNLSRSKSQGSRKAARKPVPVYDPATDPSLPLVSASLDTGIAALSPLQVADDPFERPLPAALIHKDSTGSLNVFGGFTSAPSSAHGHYMARSQSTGSRKERGLAHKQSTGFEGRPMHYLIPDMPLPQK